jgi:HD-GYP domain-containing protein (c-di-GMP phosphodiesterase class II)
VRGAAKETRVRLAELVAALSLGIDLGFGQPMEHVLRQCVIALRLAEQIGLDQTQRGIVYYTALLVNVGCHADAHEQAKWFGDDIALKSGKYDYEIGSARGVLAGMRKVGSGHPPLQRFRIGFEFAVSGRRDVDDMIRQHAALAQTLASDLRLPAEVVDAVGSAYEMWDGRGWPGERQGEQIPPAARIAQLAEYLEVANRVGGRQGAVALARSRRGTQFAPDLADLVCARADEILAGLGALDAWEEVVDAEPALALALDADELDAALTAVADFVDLKSPYTLGHAQAVAALVSGACDRLGLPDDQRRTLVRAGLVHGIGRLGVSNAILDKPGPLAPGERERVRMQPYLTECMLRQSAGLRELGAIVAHHRERLDGSGYPHGLVGDAIGFPSRILGAADAYQAMCEPRPYRAKLEPQAAARELRQEVARGRLDAESVEAVLAAAGHRIPRRRRSQAGLTAREVEVLRLLARGASNKQIAVQLVITRRTAGSHVEHIYRKIGASNRAQASLFAVRSGLMSDFVWDEA